MPNICPICGEGNLHEKVEKNDVYYRGVFHTLPLHYCECDYCGSETSTYEQSKENKRLMVAFQEAVDGERQDT